MSNTISSQAASMSNNKVAEVASINKIQATGEQGQTSTPAELNQKQPSKNEIEAAIKGLNDFLQPQQTSLQFKLYDKLNEYYVQVVDDRTKEVIQEIPSKKLLDAYSTMLEFIGVIVDKKV